MTDLFFISPVFVADLSGAATVMRDYVDPTIRTLSALGAIVCTFFIVNAGYLYMTSSGKPEKMTQAKHILSRALLGLLIILSAATLTAILAGAYGQPAGGQTASLPTLTTIEPATPSNGLVDVLIKAVTGFLNAILQTVGAPFLAALDFFTKSTPLMASNPSVFNLWLAVVGITDILFTVVLALIGFHVMSAASLGFDEIEFKHLLPRIGLVFVLLNTSIFFIDGIISLSNVLITAIGHVAGSSSPWQTLTSVVENTSTQGLAALLLMLAFLIFTVILLVYYVGRLVTLFIGTVLSPLVILAWLIPGFRDFSESAIKTYLSTIFVLFVHVVILQLAASLFTGLAPTDSQTPNVIMAIVVGLATIIALLKTQSVMMQFSYVSMGARNARMLGGQFLNGVSYMTNAGSRATAHLTGMAKRTSPSTRGRLPHSSDTATLPARKIRYDRPRKDPTGVTITRRQSEKISTPPSSPLPARSFTATQQLATAKPNSKEKLV